MTSSSEKEFLKRAEKYPEAFRLAGSKAVMEGFEYFTTQEYKVKPGAVKSRAHAMIKENSFTDLVRLLKNFAKIMPSMLRNIKQNYTDMEGYIETAEAGCELPSTEDAITASGTNSKLWEELRYYAWETHRAIVGFTELPEELIFQGKSVPFKYSLIFAQEMSKQPIEKAPKIDAGIEVVKVYNSLGIATNDIAHWLREKGIVCMANHPLGGLSDTIPLAEKAGLGAIGRHGLLITPEFGPRCRISPVFVDKKLFEFTDSNEHRWIEDFCAKCGSCIRACPKGAIYDEAKPVMAYGREDLRDRMSTFDREKCFTSFSASMGCAVCIAVCPFSKEPGFYDRMESKYSTSGSGK